MRIALAWLLAAAVLGASAAPAWAASACTNFVQVGDASRRSCVETVRERARSAGFSSRSNEDTVFFWFGSNVVTARCIGDTLIALAAYHQQSDEACPLLDRIGSAVGRAPASH